MKVPINLASRPADTSRALRSSTIVLGAIALVLAVVAVRAEFNSRNEFRTLVDRSNQVESEMRELQASQKEMRAWLQTPQVTQIRKRAALLNALISQKSLSWTRMFQDLEATLPAGARITSITPGEKGASAGQEQPELKLTVAAATITPIIEFIKRMEDSPQFANPIVGDQRFPNDSGKDGDIKISLVTRYVQKLETVADATADQDVAEENDADLESQETGPAPEAVVGPAKSGEKLLPVRRVEAVRVGGRQ
jgi:Tfp pilus assembly protein PilN